MDEVDPDIPTQVPGAYEGGEMRGTPGQGNDDAEVDPAASTQLPGESNVMSHLPSSDRSLTIHLM